MNHQNRPDDEQRAAALLRTSTSTLVPDVDRLVADGLARGRRHRRRRAVGTALAAAAVVGVIGTVASVAPRLGTDPAPRPDVGFADGGPTTSSPTPTSTPTVDPDRIDALVAVSAEDAPSVVGNLLGIDVGPIRREAPYGVRDARQEKIVHFDIDGMLTTFSIERADSLASCSAMATPAGRTCDRLDGHDIDRLAPSHLDGVTAQGISYWNHGYIVSVLSYNAAEGKESPELAPTPPLSLDQLEQLATSEVWFTS